MVRSIPGALVELEGGHWVSLANEKRPSHFSAFPVNSQVEQILLRQVPRESTASFSRGSRLCYLPLNALPTNENVISNVKNGG